VSTPFPDVPMAPPQSETVAGERRERWVMPTLLLLAIAVVGLMIGGLVYWKTVPGAPGPPPLPQEAIASGPDGVMLEEAQPVLDALAAAWLPNARPIRVVLLVDWSAVPPDAPEGTLPGGGWISAAYVAPWDAPLGKRQEAAALTVDIDRGTGRVVKVESSGWGSLPDLPPVGDAPTITSAEALLIAENEVGKTYRASCPGTHNQTRVAWATTGSDAPYWAVTYGDTRTPEKYGMLVRIDGETGLVLEAREVSQPCE